MGCFDVGKVSELVYNPVILKYFIVLPIGLIKFIKIVSFINNSSFFLLGLKLVFLNKFDYNLFNLILFNSKLSVLKDNK